MPSSTAPRAGGPRRHLTLQQKVLIIEKREREGLKQDELAQWAAAAFALPSVPTQPTISNILKDKDKLREALRLNPQRRVKTVRDVTCPQFEDAVVQWILERTTTGGAQADPRPVDRRAVLEFASGARAQFPRAKDLALSEGWLSRLIERRGITLRPSDVAEQEETEARAGDDDDEDEQKEDDAESADAGARASRRRAAEPAATAARRSLQTPPRDRRTSGTHATAAAAVASPAWSEIASPVFASTPVQTRPRRPQGVTSSATSGPHSPVALRSLASAASPLAARSARDEPRGVDAAKVYQQVCEYYGSHLTKRDELRTDAATHALGDGATPLPALLREILVAVPDAVKDKSFGCGLPLPLGIQGLHALDLGCGSGRDAYALSALVGATGSVTGVDMTPPLLNVAERHVAAFTERLRSARSSLHFVHGYMEYLDQAGIESESMDLAIANFAVSLTPNKARTLKEVFRVLHGGGEFQCSDVFTARRVPDRVRDDAVLFCEGLGGAMYVDDFRALCRDVGFGEPRVVSATPLRITDEALARRIGAAASQYVCVTYRLFKLPDRMEMRATEEDYGHVVKYLGSIPGHEAVYALDRTYRFEARRPVRVGGNTAAILKGSWLARHFHVEGDWSEHFGRFVHTPPPSGATVVDELFR